MKAINFFRESGFLVATTIGAGIFAMPFVFLKAGWALAIFYMVVLAAAIIFIHLLYLKVLKETEAKHRLLGLAKIYLGKTGFYVGLAAIVGGLLLTLVAYILVANGFVKLVIPTASSDLAMAVFWVLSSIPLTFGLKRLIGAELLGGIFMALVIVFIFFMAGPGFGFFNLQSVNFNNVFMPFGVILFALAGWTAIEPIFDFQKRFGSGLKTGTTSVFWGTVISVLLYLIFVMTILGLVSATGAQNIITEDTLSGIKSWPALMMMILGIFGLFTLWTSYVPIGLEIKNSLLRDLKWTKTKAVALIIVLPIVLALFGFRDFVTVASFAGGIFLAVQYILIALISRKVLKLGTIQKFFVDLLVFLFLAAAVYQVAETRVFSFFG